MIDLYNKQTPFLFLYTQHKYSNPKLESDLSDLFNRVRYGYKESCYWIAKPPFKFFMDFDFYDHDFILDVIPILKNIFSEYVIGESITDSNGSSYALFTNTFVDYPTAIQMEHEINLKISSFGAKTDHFIKDTQPYSYRRSLFSLHGSSRSRILLPRLDLSETKITDELGLFIFSCVNFNHE